MLVATNEQIKSSQLHTVCESARCPNRGNCFSRGTATFMILGSICTRSCRFCAVEKGRPVLVDDQEPYRLAQAVFDMGLSHVVITSVTRDDLPDGGAGHFAAVIRELRKLANPPSIEVLTPDFNGSAQALKIVIEARPEVFGHNVETVPRLYSTVRHGSHYGRSLDLLAAVKLTDTSVITKSGIMLGLGEKEEEIRLVLKDLHEAGVSMVTIGQYLAPSLRHYPVNRYLPEEEFKQWEAEALNMGFQAVASAPLVRSSYHAGENYGSVIKLG
jgi:lipoate synthase